ncbi:MAG: polysaccharide deacetylase family protein [Proteobacteria bacterium]|nr:polysaccharide deacetylase family protein [Burkholderiales bacterium]
MPVDPASPSRTLCIEIHDACTHTLACCERVMDAVNEVARCPLTWLVIPAYHGTRATDERGLVSFLDERVCCGDELSLHGFSHRDEAARVSLSDWFWRRAYTAAEGEFAAVSETEARAKIADGLSWFADKNWHCAGFVAPAWLMNPATWAALEKSPFRYTATWDALIELPGLRRIAAPALTYSSRSRWRRGASQLWVAAWGAITAKAPVLRLALHPGDAERSWQRRMLQRRIEQLLRSRLPVTVGAAVISACGVPGEAIGKNDDTPRKTCGRPRPAGSENA